MKITSVAALKSQFSAFLKASEDGPVIVTRNGKPVAVLLSVEDEGELDRFVLAYSRRFRSILDAARQQIQDGLGVRHDDFWQGFEADDARRSDRAATDHSAPAEIKESQAERSAKKKGSGRNGTKLSRNSLFD